MRITFTLFFLMLFNTVGIHIAVADRLPVEAFSQLPKSYSVKLSPNGKYIALLRNIENNTILMTVNMETLKPYTIVYTDNEKFKIAWLEWANNDKIVFSALYPDSRNMVKTSERRLLVADKHAKSEVKPLIYPRLSNSIHRDHSAQFQDNVISWLPDDPDHILVSVDFDTAIYDSVFKVNVNTRSRTRIKRESKPVTSWQTDQQGRVRIGNAYDSKSGRKYTRVLDIDTDKWQKVWERDALLDPPYVALGFGLDPHKLYVRANYEGRGAIFSVDTRHLDLEPKLIFEDPKYDIQGSLIYSPKTGEAIGVYHSQSNGGRLYWEPKYQMLEMSLNKIFPDVHTEIVSFSTDERRYILFSSSDTEPGYFYLGDREKHTLDHILSTYPMLTKNNLSPKRQVDITMSDGLEIEAYLTLPNEMPDGVVPAVIFPHGGPVSRDYGDFDYWTQFFASRGIAVLQPNFRGSSGYGHSFMQQMVGNYGLAMQSDLVDATRWMIDQGIADPMRICIVGASYGGYAALTGAFKNPDLYRCAISFAGISDLKAQRDSYRYYLNRVVAKKQYGNNTGLLKRNSAFYNVDKINIPILLVHGDRDRVVSPVQSRKLAKRLKKAGKDYEYIELKNGSHYLLKQKNRTALFNAMDGFLEKNLL